MKGKSIHPETFYMSSLDGMRELRELRQYQGMVRILDDAVLTLIENDEPYRATALIDAYKSLINSEFEIE